ncbi:hypothetical protein GCM10027089_56350 [Nocardia thraciensis]
MRFTIAITSARSVATGFPHSVDNGEVELMPRLYRPLSHPILRAPPDDLTHPAGVSAARS